MVYLIKVNYKDETLLKIGYTSDLDNRKSQYRTHNPKAEFIKVREGDMDLETFMHHYFSKYAYPDCTEWFYYNQEIVDKFDTLEVMIESRIVVNKIKSIMKNNLCNSKVFDDIDEEFKNDNDSKIRAYKVIKDIRSFYLDYIDNDLEYSNLPEYLLYNSKVEFDVSLFDDKKILISLNDIANISNNSSKLVIYYQKSKLLFNKLLDKIIHSETHASKTILELINGYRKNSNRDFSNLIPLINKSFKIQHIDYSDNFSISRVTNESILSNNDEINKELKTFYEKYNNIKNNTIEVLKLYCESGLSEVAKARIYYSFSSKIRSYLSLGKEVIKSAKYYPCKLDALLCYRSDNNTSLYDDIHANYKVGDILEKSKLKKDLRVLYNKHKIPSRAKATDIGEWFTYKSHKIKNSKTGKRIDGIELLSEINFSKKK